MKTFALGLSALAIATGVTTALCAAAPAAQETPAADAPKAGRGIDADGDGAITLAEVRARADKAWTRLDLNGDGKIDQADRDARELKRFDAIDANHDGAISRDEYLADRRAAAARIEARMDRRGARDGEADMAPPPPPMGEDADEDGPPPPAMGPGMMGPGMMGGQGPMAFLLGGPAGKDVAKDGIVTRAAYDAAIKSRFDKADRNHDGKLSRDEIRAAMPRPMGPRGRDGERMPPMGGPGMGGPGMGMDGPPMPPMGGFGDD